MTSLLKTVPNWWRFLFKLFYRHVGAENVLLMLTVKSRLELPPLYEDSVLRDITDDSGSISKCVDVCQRVPVLVVILLTITLEM